MMILVTTVASLLLTLLHEVNELALERLHCRYEHPYQMSSDMHAYLFVITHPQFSEMNGLAADFLANCWEDLGQVWREWSKEVVTP